MSLTEELEAEVRQLRETVMRLLRVGVVTSTYPERATVRVRFGDQEDVVTWECPVLYPKTGQDKEYWMPDIDEHVLVLSLPYGASQGFVVGALYSNEDKPQISNQNKKRTDFKDGAYIEYDRENSKLKCYFPKDVAIEVVGNATIDVGGDLAATAGGEATIDAPLIKHNKGTGVITEESICHFTGNPHGDGSKTVKCGKE